jgi:serine/threonine protein kinase
LVAGSKFGGTDEQTSISIEMDAEPPPNARAQTESPPTQVLPSSAAPRATPHHPVPTPRVPMPGPSSSGAQKLTTQPSAVGKNIARRNTPVPMPAGPPADSTSILPNAPIVAPQAQVFAKRDPRSETGRKKADSRQPLDFSRNSQIDRFELIRELARGGMGQVFLARDTKLGRKVAIKFLLRDDASFVQRFLIEARATARCTHENIVTIFEVGEHEGLPYMVLEYLEGKTLSDILETKPTMRQFVELMVPVARALERAHEHGIVHRDLKPSNIFVTDRGQVKVLDFGVARLVERTETAIERATQAMDAVKFDQQDESSVEFTGSNSLVGTLPYMSPEQWGADAVDALSDIWAFGIMFWRALTGVHPAGTMSPDKLRDRLTNLDVPMPSIAAARARRDRRQVPREAQGEALPECDRAARGSAGVPRAEGGSRHRRGLPLSRALGVRRGRREVLLRPLERDPHRAEPARELAAARGDRSVGRRQVVVRARRSGARDARARRRVAGARAAPGPRAAAPARERARGSARHRRERG